MGLGPFNPLISFSERQNIAERLSIRAQQEPDKLAYKFLEFSDKKQDTILTYGTLERRVNSLAAYFQDGFPAGARALLLYEPGLEFIGALLGCFHAGIIAVPALPPRPSRPSPILHSIICDATPHFVLTSQNLLPAVTNMLATSPVGQAIKVLTTDDLPAEDTRGGISRPGSTDSLAILQYTSGSTSDPKGVMISHANILANAVHMENLFGLKEATIGVSWLPAYHDMGLIGSVLQPLYTGFSAYLMSPMSFLWRPLRWLQAISTYRAHCSGGPNSAFALCTKKISPAELELLDLSSWVTAYTGAEPVHASTLRAFADKFAPCGFDRKSFSPCYGLAEATLVVSAALPGQGMTEISLNSLDYQEARAVIDESGTQIKVVGCGQPSPGIALRIVDPETVEPCIPGTIGEILIAGPSVTKGYWKRVPDHNSFLTFGDNSEQAFFRTGDLGFLYDSQLFISGRLKDMIIVSGKNHYANDIEFTVETSLSALETGASAAFAITEEASEKLVVVQEVGRSTTDETLKDAVQNISRAVAEAHDLPVFQVVFVRMGAIPRTSSGKIRRHLCRSLYHTGNLELLR